MTFFATSRRMLFGTLIVLSLLVAGTTATIYLYPKSFTKDAEAAYQKACERGVADAHAINRGEYPTLHESLSGIMWCQPPSQTDPQWIAWREWEGYGTGFNKTVVRDWKERYLRAGKSWGGIY